MTVNLPEDRLATARNGAARNKLAEPQPAAAPAELPSIALQRLARELLRNLGEDPDREGLRETPTRVQRSLEFLTQGYSLDPREVVGGALFNEEYDQLVLVRDIEFYSLCEHHLLPFFGKVQIGYQPAGKIVGLSKLPRLVDVFARRLQVQERLTREIAAAVDDLLQPRGVGVMIQASHFCMMMRGVEKQHSTTETRVLLGSLRDDERSRREFLELLSR